MKSDKVLFTFVRHVHWHLCFRYIVSQRLLCNKSGIYLYEGIWSDGLKHVLLLLENVPNTLINCDLKEIHATDLNYKAVVLTKHL